MSVLPLPMPCQDTDVDLSACLTNFVARERLFGRDGLQCARCQSYAEEGCAVSETPAILTRRSVTSTQSDIATALSPIHPQSNSTTHQTAQFLASTPMAINSKQSAPIVFPTTSSAKVITEGIRQCLLRRLPECLTIQLLRFNYDASVKKVRKIHTPVSVPLHSLDLFSATYDSAVDRDDMTGHSKMHTYALYSIILHIGGDSTNSGHYIAYCKGSGDACWYKFDDDRVSIISDIIAELARPRVKENCYLLFYRRQHENSPPS